MSQQNVNLTNAIEDVEEYSKNFKEVFKLDDKTTSELFKQYTVQIEEDLDYAELKQKRVKVVNLLSSAIEKLTDAELVLKAITTEVEEQQRDEIKNIITDHKTRKKPLPQNSVLQTMSLSEIASEATKQRAAEMQVDVWRRITSHLKTLDSTLEGLSNLHMSENKTLNTMVRGS